MGSSQTENAAANLTGANSVVRGSRFNRIAVPFAFVAILTGFVAASFYYNVTNPIWEAPDEPAHLEHVLYLVDYRDLPVRQVKQGDQLHQPPLYYLIGSLIVAGFDLDSGLPIKPNPYFVWRTERIGDQPNLAIHTLDESPPYSGTVLAVHALRALSMLFCAVAIWVAFALTRRVLPSRPWLAVATAGLTAFTPQFLFVSATLGNDGPAIAFGSLTVLAAFDIAVAVWEGRPPDLRNFLLLGLWVGLGALSKLTFFGLLPMLALVGAYTLLLARGRRLRTLGDWALSGVVAAAVGGWWFVRNLLVYGTTFDIIGQGRFDPRTTVEIQEKPEQMAQILSWYPEPLFQSFWLRFGWMNIYPERWVYDLLITLCLAAVVGLAIYLAMRVLKVKVDTGPVGLGLALCALAIVSTFTVTTWRFAYTIGNHYPQGRYLFTAQPATALLLTLGLATLAGLPFAFSRSQSPAAERWRSLGWAMGPVAAICLVVGLGVTSVAAADRYIVPAYGQAPVWLRFDPDAAPNQTRADFGGQVSLIGFVVEETTVAAGEKAALELYWRSNANEQVNLQAFVHVADESGKPVAQKDGPAGGEAYPIANWGQGEVIRDRRLVPIDPNVPAGTYQVLVGLYSLETMQRIPLSGSGETAVRLAPIVITAP